MRRSGILPAERHERITRQIQHLSQRSKMLVYQFDTEPVMTRRHRCMRGENNAPTYPRRCLRESEALVLHAVTDCFEDCESTMALVQVQDSGSNAQRTQGTKS